ncbi:Uncharacterised protein [Mycobacteroides abscessus subsp. abscessus]|uniref:DUF7255 family protein n=1 Tax=Mycobacteroides abscessus TaxID=36809 RepID=UPI00092A43C2|nr:hypothetical protein [Mycobacteroides abscessus]SIB35356.1 Uncharacterised protein [Mycobacteroides abscessus subsp. abscessus]SIG01504.1 Uncharacterised protein [Mycobacteroides abscessus subsp. abscessus]
MRERESELGRLLGALDVKVSHLRVATLPGEAQHQLSELYVELGGVSGPIPTPRPGGWDIALPDGRVVELDEEQHFNRYRELTLRYDWASRLPWCSEYRDYSQRYEFVCKRVASGGAFWSSPVAERMFGCADSSRWKQRALYDATKDMAALHGIIRMARLSVWDTVDGAVLGNVVAGLSDVKPGSLMALVNERTVW